MKRRKITMINKDPNYPIRGTVLLNALHKLWEQHIMWTRSFIISTIDNLADLNYVKDQLLENPSDFANVLRPFYGDQYANQFKELLTQYLLIAGDLVNATKQGNTQKVNEAHQKWYANADDMAEFLASINPYWNQKEWQPFLYSHLEMTENEAVGRLMKKYEENVKQYDEIEEEALKMADYMYQGMTSQFRI